MFIFYVRSKKKLPKICFVRTNIFKTNKNTSSAGTHLLVFVFSLIMGRKCHVLGCTSRYRVGASYHAFPRDAETCLKWVCLSGNRNLVNKTFHELKEFTLCTKHFHPDVKTTDARGVVFKEKGTLPSLYLPNPIPPNEIAVVGDDGFYLELSEIPFIKNQVENTGPPSPNFLDSWTVKNPPKPKPRPVMDPIQLLPINMQEEELEEFEGGDEIPLTPPQLEEEELDPEIVDAIRRSEMDQRCRMCAENKEDMKNLFSTEAMEQNLPHKMKKYVYITVSEDDQLPLQMCGSCEAKLETSVALAESCAAAQTFLNNLLTTAGTQRPLSPVASSPPTSPEMPPGDLSDNPEDAEDIETSEQQQLEEFVNSAATSSGEFDCKKCCVSCVDRDDLEYHYSDKHEVFLCTENCDLIFTTWYDLQQHIKQVHKVSIITEKENSMMKFVTIEKPKEPKEGNEKKSNELKCPICDKVFRLRSRLKYHMLRHGGLRQKECPVCHKWMDIDVLRSHKNTHEAPQFKCDMCQRLFNCKRYINIHIQKVHMKEWFYECNICNKKHTNMADIKKHVRTHKNVELTIESKLFIKKSKFQCKKCKRYSANKLHFKDHLLKHKRIEKIAGEGKINEAIFQCEVCAKMLKTSVSLKLHVQTHRGEKTHQCKYCPSKFLHKGTLDTHEKIHEGDFAFKCNLCPKAYVRETILRNHIRKAHLNLRPFECTFCNKTFHTADNLRVHTRIHTGDRPFSCQFCSRQFTQKHEMKRHEATHSNGFVYNCKNCKFGSNQKKKVTEHICNETVSLIVT